MTAAPYGSTTVWHFMGTTQAITAATVPYKAGKQGSESSASGSGG